MATRAFVIRLSLSGALLAGTAMLNGRPADPSSPATPGEIRIGLLIPDESAIQAKQGAELAIREANRGGGVHGKSFRLVTRSVDGPWGAGSKESVGLVFEDGVVAMLTSLDGRNAHLAEQVAAKTRVLLLSCWAGDMTLTGAFVPWYYRCVPNDDQQAVALARAIAGKEPGERVAVIAADDYDSQNVAESFACAADSMGITLTGTWICRTGTETYKDFLEEAGGKGSGAVVICGDETLAGKVLSFMREKKMDQAVFGTLSVSGNPEASRPDWKSLEGLYMLSAGFWFSGPGTGFRNAFREAYGDDPGAAAAYAYDGMNLIIGVVRRTGPDRDRIISGFSRPEEWTGVTGPIRFDSSGNRRGIPGLMTVTDGVPVPLKSAR